MIKVNADYETELFTGGPGPKGINEAIEFFAFFLTEEEVLTSKSYSKEYLDYVESLTGHRPKTRASGSARNWWGPLINRDKEKHLNSKITSTELALKEEWIKDTFILRNNEDVPSLKSDVNYLVKSPFEMSGRGFAQIKNWDENPLKKFPLIVEPFLNRKYDFSFYKLKAGPEVYYQNLVDEKFQFKGSVFRNQGRSLSDLSFYTQLNLEDWQQYSKAKDLIISEYASEIEPGFSVDSFIYEEKHQLKIHILSEVNARRTMGVTAYEIGKRFGSDRNWWALLLGKSLKPQGGFNYLRSKLQILMEEKKVLILSPGDTRFEILFLMAQDDREGEELLIQVHALLPEAQFPTLR